MNPPRPRRGSAREAAARAIRLHGGRVTVPRTSVLRALLGAERSLTHQEVVDRLGGDTPVDRVTVYRVLDWLVERGLAHRAAHGDRLWRYAATLPQGEAAAAKARKPVTDAPGADHAHAHFICEKCRRSFCLEQVPAQLAGRLPPGYRARKVEISIEGVCRGCR